MIRASIAPDEAVAILNDLARADAGAMRALVMNRVPCSHRLTELPGVQAEHDDAHHYVGLMGVLNALFGTYDRGDFEGFGAITVRLEQLPSGQPGKLLGFCLTTDQVGPKERA